MRLALVALVSVLTLAQAAVADNWPQWRGPNAAGIAAEGDYPVDFSGDENVTWKVESPGVGSSSPTVWGDAIFVTSIIDGQDGLSKFDFNGKELWQKKLGPGLEGKHRNGSGSNPSPVTDGMHVVTYFKSGRVACHDFDGNELWQVNLQEKYGENTLWWDLGTSPVLVDGKVVIAVMQSGDSYLVALDVANKGAEVWKQKRQYVRPEESDHAYTTPQLANVDGRDVIVTWGADYLTGHDAKTGEPLWELGPFNPKEEANWRVIASHAMGDGVAVVPYGRGKFLAGVPLKVEHSGTPQPLWEEQGEVGPDVPTPIVAGGKVYILTDTGKVVCRDLKTGDELWADALPRDKDKYYASPVLADEKLYFTREDGVVFVADVSDGFKLLTSKDGNDMGERIIATPAPVRDSLLIRGEKHLFRIGGGETKTAAAKQ
ncbi:MAG: PQQ-like beta-propeller repeat protein [Pirellulales bacterium]|nr:PQQ-like beta-propeller repeat protein [Pirellulales bacterium]